MENPNPYATPQANVERPEGFVADIENLPVSRKWKERFSVIHAAGGPRFPDYKKLPPRERHKVIRFNFLAFLLGPLYYIAKGMWRKALTLFLACLVAVVVVGMALEAMGYGAFVKYLGYGAAAVFAVRANIDYYKKMVLGDNGWW